MLRKLIYPLGIVLILGISYILTLAPDISWANGGADGGDLITATAVNGVPHPTGYPLYLLIAKVFQWLPISNLAFRTNLMSAVCTILAALMVYRTVLLFQKESKYGESAALFAALIFGLSPMVWSQAVIAEVYGLQSLLTISIVYLTIQIDKKPREDLIFGVLFGLALGNHITTIFLLPLLVFEKEKFKIISTSQLFSRLVGICMGASIYLILPLRALNQPSINWLNPVSLAALYKLVTGQIYQSYFSLGFLLERTRAWAGFLLENLSMPLVFLGIFSIFENNKKRWINYILSWIFLVYSIFALIYTSYDSYIYLIQTLIAFSIWIGISLERSINLIINRWKRIGWILISLFILFFCLRIYFVMPKVDASKDDRAATFGQTVLDTVPENVILFTKDDQTTFALWYFHFANSERKDITLIAEGLMRFDWYRQSLRIIYPSISVPEIPNLEPFQLITINSERPYCFVEYQDSTVIKCSQY